MTNNVDAKTVFSNLFCNFIKERQEADSLCPLGQQEAEAEPQLQTCYSNNIILLIILLS
jgi:hypothetical protein